MILILSMILQTVQTLIHSLIALNMVALIIFTSNTDGNPPNATYQGTPFSNLLQIYDACLKKYSFWK